MQGQKILIVDDDAAIRTALYRALDRKAYDVITASSKAEALTLIQTDRPLDLALVDLKLDDGNGLDLMIDIKGVHNQAQVIILTGFGTIETAVEATKRGACHFVTKPFNLDEVISLIDNILSRKKLEKENLNLRSALHSRYKFNNIVGQSEEVKNVLDMVERVAQADSTVLVTGESGTGKELIAKAVHYNSARASGPFVPINCGAIPGELLESELFGHVKGAFTNAVNNRVGRFELAEGGTVFFDEIGDMKPSLQVKLLRVLQEKRFEPVGGTKTICTDVRIIAATNVDLEKAVEDGRFREDLFYRLNVIPINVPALRERRTDIPLLFHHFLEKFNKNKAPRILGITQEAMDVLSHYTWPGNIRELENLVERMTILKGNGVIDVRDLPDRYRGMQQFQAKPRGSVEIPDTGMDFNSAVDSYENALILRALEKTGWNRNQAAILLKLNRTTLVEKIKKKGLRPPQMEV